MKMLSFFPSLEDYVTWLMEGLRWVGWIITIMPSFIFIMQKIYLGVFAHWIKSILRKKKSSDPIIVILFIDYPTSLILRSKPISYDPIYFGLN